MTTVSHPLRHDSAHVDTLLDADRLSALMRSTWTWDDRALRRDLSTLLVMRAAATHAHDDTVVEALQAGSRSYAARFVASVLGPKLIADTGNPLREAFMELAGDPASFLRAEHAARRAVAAQAEQYFAKHVDGLDYAAPDEWAALIDERGADGLGIAMRAYGHDLSDTPLLSSKTLAWQAVSLVPNDHRAADYAHRLQSGKIVGTLAAAEQTGSWDPALVRTRAQDRDGWRLSGTKTYVPSAGDADVVFIIGRSIAGPSLFAVEAGAEGLDVTPHDVLDGSRPLFEVTLSDTPATLIGVDGSGGRLMSLLIDRATTALAAEQVGLIEAAITLLRNTSEFNNDRLAELVLDHGSAYALWQHALTDPGPGAAAAAHIGCSAAAVRVATTVAEICGPDDTTTAIVRRSLSGSLLFGGPALSHERLLERLGI